MSIKTDQGQVLFSFEFHHGNCGYDDGEQCRVCGDLSGITGRLDQRIGNSGIFYTGCRRSNCLCVFLIRGLGFGPMGVWIGMFADWTVRAIIFTWRFHSRKWLNHKVI